VEQKRDSKLLELQNIVGEKERVNKSQLDELQDVELTADQQQSDLKYAWNRIRRCEGKIRNLIEQLETFEQRSRYFSGRPNFGQFNSSYYN